jgi:hypothetical protein
VPNTELAGRRSIGLGWVRHLRRDLELIVDKREGIVGASETSRGDGIAHIASGGHGGRKKDGCAG